MSKRQARMGGKLQTCVSGRGLRGARLKGRVAYVGRSSVVAGILEWGREQWNEILKNVSMYKPWTWCMYSMFRREKGEKES